MEVRNQDENMPAGEPAQAPDAPAEGEPQEGGDTPAEGDDQ